MTAAMFRRRVSTAALALAIVFGAIVARAPADDDPQLQQARQQLAGVWKGYAVDGKGENPDRGPVKLTVTITDTAMHGIEHTQSNPSEAIDHGSGEFTIELTPAAAHLDATQTNERGRKIVYLGIYTLDGDTLKWCVTRQKTRPTTMQTGGGSFLMILRRDKT